MNIEYPPCPKLANILKELYINGKLEEDSAGYADSRTINIPMYILDPYLRKITTSGLAGSEYFCQIRRLESGGRVYYKVNVMVEDGRAWRDSSGFGEEADMYADACFCEQTQSFITPFCNENSKERRKKANAILSDLGIEGY